MPYDEIIIGLSHNGVKGNPAFHSHILAEAFPDRACLSIRMDRWMSVAEIVKPPADTLVLAYDGERVFQSKYCDGFWENDAEVTHWMPLPEPPEEA